MGWPDGTEKGDYLAVDLGSFNPMVFKGTPLTGTSLNSGGTNLRVCSVALEGDGKFEITQTKYKLTEEQKQDDGQKLCSCDVESKQMFD